MLASLPLLFFIALTLVFGIRFPSWGWRLAFLRATLTAATYLLVVTELLSVFRWITPAGLIAMWATPTLLTAWWIRRSGSWGQVLGGLRRPRLRAGDWMMVFVLAAVLFSTGLLAWYAPPNTRDALTTHMSRVAHWAQERSVRPYLTGIPTQNYYPPLPGMMVLHTYVLAGGDQFANFVQWMAMVVSVVGVSLMARDLGCGRSGQLFAGAFVATLPVGIAQASSSMTDYIVALWIVILGVETLRLMKRPSHWAPVLALGLAAAFTVLTKPTGYPYLAPFAVIVALVLVRKVGTGALLRRGIVAGLLVLGLSAGFFWRNVSVYGHPMGERSRVGVHRNEILGWQVVVSNALRNASLHAGSPIAKANAGVYRALEMVHRALGLELADPRTSIHPWFGVGIPSTDEVLMGNPAQAAIILLVTVAMAFMWRAVPPQAKMLSLGAISAFILAGWVYKFSVHGARYHLPFFALYAPVVAWVVGRKLPDWLMGLLALALLWASLPWMANLQSRALFRLPWGPPVRSVLATPREQMYLGPGAVTDAYLDIAARIRRSGCENVYLMLSGGTPEYPFWAFLGAPRTPVQIQWNVAGTPADRFRKDDFVPCAVICDKTCPAGRDEMLGLPLIYEHAGFRLYMRR
jgi:hypothetical protein